MKAFVKGWLFVPLQALGANRVSMFQNELTIVPRKMKPNAPEPKPILMYDLGSEPGYIGLPIDWAMERLGNELYDLEDRTSRGQRVKIHKLPDPNHPLAAKGQDVFMENMLEGTKTMYAFLAQAGTGTGKTVAALYMAGVLRRSTLIIVPSEGLLIQWQDEIADKLGIPRHMIGTVQQNKCEHRKPVVVAMVHSLVNREYEPEFYDSFGIVIWDEVHRMGAYTFAQSLGMFTASVKVALTATPDRKDGTAGVFLYYFGYSQIKAAAETLPCQIRVLKHHASNMWGDNREGLLMCIAQDKKRNAKILKLVAKLYDNGRYILVIGDKIKHLQELKAGMLRDGVPEENMGQFTASYYENVKDEKAKKTPKADLERIKSDPNVFIIFTTYGSMKEGIDIPRLDAGIDVTPRSEGIQVIGRIRRKLAGKPMPIWYTIMDTASGQIKGYAKARIKDYLKSDNVEVIGYD